MDGSADDRPYMREALDLLPQPAALYEWPSLRFVSWNQASQRRAEELGALERHGEPGLGMVGLTDEEVVVAVQAAKDRSWIRPYERGELRFSVCAPLPGHSRPALLLATAHADSDNAKLEHARARVALYTNEGIEAAEAQLTTSLQVVAATVESIREVGRVVNENLWLAAHINEDDEKNPHSTP